MLRATFLGWQGWLIESENRRLLFDPLLVEDVGRGPDGARLRGFVYPPRRWCWEELPPVDAVFLSHEHEDHFNVPTLVRISRSIPIYLSDRSSTAAWTFCRELGFDVRPFVPGASVAIGDLEVAAFAQDADAALGTDEWDTLAYLVRHTGGSGSFFTNVDIGVTDEMVAAVEHAGRTSHGAARATLTYQGMMLTLAPPVAKPGDTTEEPPAAGTSFSDPEQARARFADGEAMGPLPGQRFVLRHGELAEMMPTSPFLETPPREEWPKRVPIWRTEEEPLRPAVRETDLDPADLAEIEVGLARLAEFLYGRKLVRLLASLGAERLGGRAPTIAWVLLQAQNEALVYEYAPRECSFRLLHDPGPHDALARRYVGVVTSYASDLLALLRGQFEPRVITRSLAESWSVPGGFFLGELWLFFHPLRHPRTCLARYRAFAAELGDVPHVVRPPR